MSELSFMKKKIGQTDEVKYFAVEAVKDFYQNK